MTFALAAGEVCLTLLVALILVLRHLEAMRVSTGEVSMFKDIVNSHEETVNALVLSFTKRMDDFDTRLVHVNNRTAAPK